MPQQHQHLTLWTPEKASTGAAEFARGDAAINASNAT